MWQSVLMVASLVRSQRRELGMAKVSGVTIVNPTSSQPPMVVMVSSMNIIFTIPNSNHQTLI